MTHPLIDEHSVDRVIANLCEPSEIAIAAQSIADRVSQSAVSFGSDEHCAWLRRFDEFLDALDLMEDRIRAARRTLMGAGYYKSGFNDGYYQAQKDIDPVADDYRDHGVEGLRT